MIWSDTIDHVMGLLDEQGRHSQVLVQRLRAIRLVRHGYVAIRADTDGPSGDERCSQCRRSYQTHRIMVCW
jgi:hypothetical protein